MRVQFVPERTKMSSGTYTRALVDSEQLEWIELSADAKDSGGDVEDPTIPSEGEEENPLG